MVESYDPYHVSHGYRSVVGCSDLVTQLLKLITLPRRNTGATCLNVLNLDVLQLCEETRGSTLGVHCHPTPHYDISILTPQSGQPQAQTQPARLTNTHPISPPPKCPTRSSPKRPPSAPRCGAQSRGPPPQPPTTAPRAPRCRQDQPQSATCSAKPPCAQPPSPPNAPPTPRRSNSRRNKQHTTPPRRRRGRALPPLPLLTPRATSRSSRRKINGRASLHRTTRSVPSAHSPPLVNPPLQHLPPLLHHQALPQTSKHKSTQRSKR